MKLALVLSVVYLVCVSVFMLSHRLWFSPDQFFFVALFGALFLGRTQMFILDWGPFLSLFFGYEFLRGLVPIITTKVNILPMLHFDQWLFGANPSAILQSKLYSPVNLHWYDYLLVTLYICHFITPMLVGFILWIKDRASFKKYAIAFLILSYAAFFTFIIFPAMPPWMASDQGFIPPLKQVTGVVMSHFLATTVQVPTIYAVMRANPVAAVPSLHAAFPTLIFLFIWKKSKKLGLLFAPYVLGVWFAVIYLGEHYFFDVLIGAIYALIAFNLVDRGTILAEFVKHFLPQKKLKVIWNSSFLHPLRQAQSFLARVYLKTS